jgi:hypothetical protein
MGPDVVIGPNDVFSPYVHIQMGLMKRVLLWLKTLIFGLFSGGI